MDLYIQNVCNEFLISLKCIWFHFTLILIAWISYILYILNIVYIVYIDIYHSSRWLARIANDSWCFIILLCRLLTSALWDPWQHPPMNRSFPDLQDYATWSTGFCLGSSAISYIDQRSPWSSVRPMFYCIFWICKQCRQCTISSSWK